MLIFIIFCGLVGAFFLYPEFRQGCLGVLGAVAVGFIVIIGGIAGLLWMIFHH